MWYVKMFQYFCKPLIAIIGMQLYPLNPIVIKLDFIFF